MMTTGIRNTMSGVRKRLLNMTLTVQMARLKIAYRSTAVRVSAGTVLVVTGDNWLTRLLTLQLMLQRLSGTICGSSLFGFLGQL